MGNPRKRMEELAASLAEDFWAAVDDGEVGEVLPDDEGVAFGASGCVARAFERSLYDIWIQRRRRRGHTPGGSDAR